jgi:hypothetical protein
MDENLPSTGFRLSLKDVLLTLAASGFALGSLRSDDVLVVVPMLALPATALIIICVLHSGSRTIRNLVAGVICLILGFVGWRDLRAPTQTAPNTNAPVATVASKPVPQSQPSPAQSPVAHVKHHSRHVAVASKNNAPAVSGKGITLGTDAVGYGTIPDGTKIGNGSVLVGPTDSNGNTILNHGGTAIGRGATADPTSIAIGANAHAGGSAPPARGP